MEVPTTLTVGEETFEHVKTRVYAPVAVYKGNNSYLRIGPKEELEPEAEFHQKLLGLGFPVPQIVASGELNGSYYYIEQSLGEKHLGEMFAEDVKKDGRISDKNFKTFLGLTTHFAQAQLKTASPNSWEDGFYGQIHVDYLLEELPDLQDKTQQAMDQILKRLQGFPAVLSHGDFNPWNLFPTGVIDIERFKLGPAGYDLISNIFSAYMFPPTLDGEPYRSYEFTQDQITEYLNTVDNIYTANRLPKLSDFKDEYIFGRLIFAVVRMHHRPSLQKWRYDLYRKVLDAYLTGEPVSPLVTNAK